MGCTAIKKSYQISFITEFNEKVKMLLIFKGLLLANNSMQNNEIRDFFLFNFNFILILFKTILQREVVQTIVPKVRENVHKQAA